KELAKIQGLIVINGDGTRPYILEDANANEMDIAIALTTRDDNNLIICELCKKKYNIKKTVALVNDANKTEFFYRMGIDSVVCATNAITSIIEQQAFIDEVETYIPISEGKISIIELPITANAPTIGKKLWEIDLPK
ncbi:MAG: NAD-binding protein, partial [Erysipelotrichaceae bacterium]